jgi:hypothetical protein
MLLIIHIIIALLSLISAGLAFLKPNPKRLNTSYTLVGLTIASGTILTIQLPSHLMESCVAGLIYLAAVFMAIVAARLKLAQINTTQE